MKNKIKCDVKTCNYNNSNKNRCNLNSIKITSINNKDCTNQLETICQSFEKTSSPINDNVYEITSETEK